jgi:hypothetical protein
MSSPEHADPTLQVVEQRPGGDPDVWGEHGRASGRDRQGHGDLAVVPAVDPLIPLVGSRVGPGGQGLAQAGRAEARADVPVTADRIGELDESAMLFGDLDVRQPPRRTLTSGSSRLAHRTHASRSTQSSR